MIYIDIKKSFKNANFHFRTEIASNSLNAVFGKSGSGKTTLLRLLSGLEIPNEGVIKVDDEIWFDSTKNINLTPQKRDTGFVFQDYALFPNMSVIENLRFAQPTKDENFIEELLDIVELTKFKNKYPELLSGGQKQRVALARAVAKKPKLLLLDEALSALDSTMRVQLQNDIEQIHKRLNLTTLMISHDIAEVYKLASNVLIVEDGKIKKSGNPDILFENSQLSGKFKFSAKIMKIDKADTIFIVTLLIQNNLTKVVATQEEVQNMSIGDDVLVASKAFNPIIVT